MRRAFAWVAIVAMLATGVGLWWRFGLIWPLAVAMTVVIMLVVSAARSAPTTRTLPPSRVPSRPTLGGAPRPAGSAEPSRPPEHRAPPTDDVWCTAYSPPACAAGDTALVQVFTHRRTQSAAVRRMAVEFDGETMARGTTQLDRPVARGAQLTFVLSMKDAEVEPAVQQLIWRGEIASVQFSIAVPKSMAGRNLIGTVYVAEDAVPFGHLKFVIRVSSGDQRADAPTERQSTDFKHYCSAFISYASPDRSEVLKRVQMLARLSIPFFQDVLSLEPGERWARALYKNIDTSDVFFLFWSTHAKNSPWVMKEVQYAIECKGGDEFRRPEIVPVIIEGPPPVPPPPELAHLHFNDRLIYFMRPGDRPA